MRSFKLIWTGNQSKTATVQEKASIILCIEETSGRRDPSPSALVFSVFISSQIPDEWLPPAEEGSSWTLSAERPT